MLIGGRQCGGCTWTGKDAAVLDGAFIFLVHVHDMAAPVDDVSATTEIALTYPRNSSEQPCTLNVKRILHDESLMHDTDEERQERAVESGKESVCKMQKTAQNEQQRQ